MAAEPRAPESPPGSEAEDDGPRLIKILRGGCGHAGPGLLALDLDRAPPVVLEALAATGDPAQTVRWRGRRLLLAWLRTGALAAALAPAGFAVARGTIAMTAAGRLVELFNGVAHCRVLFRAAFAGKAEPPPLLVLLRPEAAPEAPPASALPAPALELPAAALGPELPASALPEPEPALGPEPSAPAPGAAAPRPARARRPRGSPLQLGAGAPPPSFRSPPPPPPPRRASRRPRPPGSPLQVPAEAATSVPISERTKEPRRARASPTGGSIWTPGPRGVCDGPEAVKKVCATLRALKAAARLRAAAGAGGPRPPREETYPAAAGLRAVLAAHAEADRAEAELLCLARGCAGSRP
jgi:hypothetical protein